MSLFDIQNVTVGPRNLTARVRLANGAPVRTAEDIEGTNRVYQLMPQIADHACVSPQGDVFRDVLGDTELAHLLEHVTVELMARLGVEDVSAGNTAQTDEERVWDYSGGAGPEPDVDHTVAGLRELVDHLPAPQA